MNKIVYHYVLDTMADWETGFLTAELNSGRYFKQDSSKYKVVTFSLTKEPVKTIGGITIIPDILINNIDMNEAALLILPGGDTWLDDMHAPVYEVVKKCFDAGIPVAAICGATMGLAQAGFMNNKYHTSNDLNFLKAVCPAYTGESFYKLEPAVTGGNLITASGGAPLEFAREALKWLGVFSDDTLEYWYKLYLTHEAKYFYSLMESVK